MKFWSLSLIVSTLISLILSPVAEAAGAKAENERDAKTPWADFVEADFPFFSSVLDAREARHEFLANNLTPRGLILNLGNDCWACFDIDILRISAIWQGTGVTLVGMANGSYHRVGEKAPEGQENLPKIIGPPWIANGLYPGWQAGEQTTQIDPREIGPDIREVGRGPLTESLGRFKAIRLTRSGVCLEYEVGGVAVSEWVESKLDNRRRLVQRRFRLEGVRQPLWLLLGHRRSEGTQRLQTSLSADEIAGKRLVSEVEESTGLIKFRVEPSAKPIEFRVAVGMAPTVKKWKLEGTTTSDAPADVRWRQAAITRGKLAQATEAFVFDDIPFPLENPWKRN